MQIENQLRFFVETSILGNQQPNRLCQLSNLVLTPGILPILKLKYSLTCILTHVLVATNFGYNIEYFIMRPIETIQFGTI